MESREICYCRGGLKEHVNGHDFEVTHGPKKCNAAHAPETCRRCCRVRDTG